MRSKTVFFSILLIIILKINKLILDPRYGILADVNNDGAYEFISENLALTYKENKLTNIVNDTKFKDKKSFTIGVGLRYRI